MRAELISTAAVCLLLAACDIPSTKPQPLTGTFELVRFDGAELPAVWPLQGTACTDGRMTSAHMLDSGALDVTASGIYHLRLRGRQECTDSTGIPATSTTFDVLDDGMVERISATRLRLHAVGFSTRSMEADLAGDSLAFRTPAPPFIFVRRP